MLSATCSDQYHHCQAWYNFHENFDRVLYLVINLFAVTMEVSHGSLAQDEQQTVLNIFVFFEYVFESKFSHGAK